MHWKGLRSLFYCKHGHFNNRIHVSFKRLAHCKVVKDLTGRLRYVVSYLRLILLTFAAIVYCYSNMFSIFFSAN